MCTVRNDAQNDTDLLGLRSVPPFRRVWNSNTKFDGCKSCDTEINAAKKNAVGADPIIVDLADKLSNKNCDVVWDCFEGDKCDKADPPVNFADASHTPGYGPGRGNCRIRFCGSKFRDKTTLVTMIRHELVHCWSYCQGDHNDGDCAGALCRELYAYALSGTCADKQGNMLLYEDCLAKAAQRSAESHCIGKNMKSILEKPGFILHCRIGGTAKEYEQWIQKN